MQYDALEELLLTFSNVFNGGTFAYHGFIMNTWMLSAMLAVVGLGLLATRGPGLWAKICALVLVLCTVPAIMVAMHFQLSLPLRATPAWLAAQNAQGGVVLVHPPVKRPERKIIELYIDSDDGITRYMWIPLTRASEESADGMMQQYLRNKQKGTMRFRFRMEEHSLNPDENMRFYYDPPQAPPPKDGGASPTKPDGGGLGIPGQDI